MGPPHLVSTMVRATLLSSVRDRQQVVDDRLADLYIDVAVEGGGLLDFSTGAAIADAAAESTRPVLERWVRGDAEEGEAHVQTQPVIAAPPPPSGRGWRGVMLLTARDLQHRATKLAAVIVGTAVVLTLLFLITGLVEQFQREPRETIAALGADLWMVRDGASGAFTSAAISPASVADEVTGTDASPVVIGRETVTADGETVDVVVIGYEPDGIGEPGLPDGELPSAPREIAIDDSAGVAVGETIELGGTIYTVSGRTDGTTMFAGMPIVFLPLESAQAILYREQPLAAAVLLDGEPSALPDGYHTLDNEAIAVDALRPLDGAISSVNLIRFLLWFVAALIIGTMSYLTALERLRDMAVLKAVGASTRQLATSIAVQGAIVALLAAGPGCAPPIGDRAGVPDGGRGPGPGALAGAPDRRHRLPPRGDLRPAQGRPGRSCARLRGAGRMTAGTANPVVQVRDLVIEYDTSGYVVRPIDHFDLSASAGELVVLLGPSGCGKTSLLSALGGILRPTSGSIRVAGIEVEALSAGELSAYRQHTVGFVFQAFNLIPSLTARENVAIPLLLAGVSRRRAMRRADELLARVDLADRARHRPNRLSGGQQQRVAVARGLAADAPVLLADEPTANLDYIQAEGIISLLRGLRADGRSIIVSTHDDRLVPIADRVVHLVPEHRADAGARASWRWRRRRSSSSRARVASWCTSSRPAPSASSAGEATAPRRSWLGWGRASTSVSSVLCSGSPGRPPLARSRPAC